MYVCDDCDEIFEEADSETVCWEDEYGVYSMFSNHTYGEIEICPYCGSREIYEVSPYYGIEVEDYE